MKHAVGISVEDLTEQRRDGEKFIEALLREVFRERAKTTGAGFGHVGDDLTKHLHLTASINVFSVETQMGITEAALNRPEIYITKKTSFILRVTTSLYRILTWEEDSALTLNSGLRGYHRLLGAVLKDLAHEAWPAFVGPLSEDARKEVGMYFPDSRPTRVLPEQPQEAHCTFKISSSLRHLAGQCGSPLEIIQATPGEGVAQAPIVFDPQLQRLIGEKLDHIAKTCSTPEDRFSAHDLSRLFNNMPILISGARTTYGVFSRLVARFLAKGGAPDDLAQQAGVDAAHGLLPAAVQTTAIYTGSLVAWREAIRRNCSEAVGCEDRMIYGHILELFKGSEWAPFFNHLELEPATDGLASRCRTDK